MNLAVFFTDLRVVAGAALTACLLWGSAFPAVKYGYALWGIAPGDTPALLLFAGYRFTLAGALVIGFAALSGLQVLALTPRRWCKLIILGLVLTTLQYLFFYLGLARTTGVRGAVLNATGPFFSVILVHFIRRDDRLHLRSVIGCLTGFLGVVVINQGGGTSASPFQPTGEGFILLSSFCMAIAGIYGKAVSREINPIVMTGWQLGIGGAVLILLGGLPGGTLTPTGASSMILLGYLAFISAAAFTLSAILMKYNPVSRVSVFNFSIPVFGAGLSALFLGENLFEAKNLIALALVSFGIRLVTVRRRGETETG